MTARTVEPQSDLLNIDFRDELRPVQGCEGLSFSGDELLGVLSSFNRYGFWQLNVDTADTVWSEDVYAIHSMPYTPGRIDLDYAMDRYHADDKEFLPKLIADTVENKSGFQFVLRLKAPRNRYKLVRSIGKYRERTGGIREIIGVFSEFQPAVRMIGAAI